MNHQKWKFLRLGLGVRSLALCSGSVVVWNRGGGALPNCETEPPSELALVNSLLATKTEKVSPNVNIISKL